MDMWLLGAGVGKTAWPTGQMCGPHPKGPSLGAGPATQWDFSLVSLSAGAEVFYEVSWCSCLQMFLCRLFQFHSDNQGG